MKIDDGISNKEIWNFSQVYSGGVASSHKRLVNAILRKATRKMPYKQ